VTARTFSVGALLAVVAGSAAPVLAAPGTATSSRAAPRSAAPQVTLLVAGTQGTLLPAQRVRVSAGRLPVPGAGRCPLGPGTPLAALDAARRRGRLRFGVRRQSACTPETLFVDDIDGRRNAGDGGWEYKVDGRTPAVGAAVPAGQGGARLHSGSRVLWFYCLRANRCQATLELRLAARAQPGAPLTVSVLGRDDNGRATPVAGAAVTVAGATAITDALGAVHLVAPARPGSYPVSATAPGLVDAFPQALRVG